MPPVTTTQEFTLAAVTFGVAGASGGSDVGQTVDIGDAKSLAVELTVTDLSGTSPTLTVTVQATNNDDEEGWSDLGSLAADAVGTTSKTFRNPKRLVRASFSLAGADPTARFQVTATPR